MQLTCCSPPCLPELAVIDRSDTPGPHLRALRESGSHSLGALSEAVTLPPALMIVAAAVFCLTGCSPAGCGFERWRVKDALDRAAGQIDLIPRGTTIAAMTALPAPFAPSLLRYNSRYRPVETTVYRISATLTRIAHSSDDGDYHLILSDEDGRTMVVEAPDPVCANGSPLEAQIAGVRHRIDARFHSFPSYPRALVVAVGVGFFDRVHSVIGQAPNGIELHPLTDLEWR